MKSPTKLDSVSSEIQRLPAHGTNPEAAIALMRRRGLNKLESIKLLMQSSDLTLAQAKARIHFSPTWADALDHDNHLHDALLQASETGASSREPTPDHNTVAPPATRVLPG